ncbi:MAG: NAD(+)/NADH kinase, partial [Pseudomonadota bacterium]
MHTPFNTIGLIGKPSDPSIADTLSLLYQYLIKSGYRVLGDTNSAGFTGQSAPETSPIEQLGTHCDLVIAAGGDGTFLTAARALANHDAPLIGVNLGRVGFLVDISPDEAISKLHTMLAGKFITENRSLLRAKIIRNGNVIHEETAVNEVVVHRWITSSMIEIDTTINGVFLNSQRSDGLIVSTPTGSTAYALSGGGPILHPSLQALVLVPLNPHALTNRPIVIDDRSEIEIAFKQTK